MINKLVTDEGKGYKTFNDIRNFIGEESAARLEKGIIKEVFDNPDTTIEKAIKELTNFDFATTEGRSILASIKKASDGLINARTVERGRTLLKPFEVGKVSAGWSDNVISKAKYEIVGRAYSAIRRRGIKASPERVLARVADVIDRNKNNIVLDKRTNEVFDKYLKEERTRIDKRIGALERLGRMKSAKENKEHAMLKKDQKDIDKSLAIKEKPSVSKSDGYNLDDIINDVEAEMKADPDFAKEMSPLAERPDENPVQRQLRLHTTASSKADYIMLNKEIKKAKPDEKATKGNPLYRGLALTDDEYQDIIKKGYVSRKPESFTRDRGTAKLSAEGLTIGGRKTKKDIQKKTVLILEDGDAVNIGKNNQFGFKGDIEREALVPKGKKYKVIGVGKDETGKYNFIRVKEI